MNELEQPPPQGEEQIPDAQETAAAETDPPESKKAASAKRKAKEVSIVAIGASAGGLEAMEELFRHMPAETGLAFVVVVHLAPDRHSMLSELLQRCTRMRVVEAKDGMRVEANCVYVIAPAKEMGILNGRLQLMEPSTPRNERAPIDFFFRSLANEQAERAVGIILSGSGTNGTIGLKMIKEVGGMGMVQTPESAKYSAMPQSAIGAGLADYILPPAQMPVQLLDYIQNFRLKTPQPEERRAFQNGELNKIFMLLRTRTGHDFSHYKHSTIERRIARRMALHKIGTVTDYIRYLSTNPSEVELLFQELLIGVTSFFRDPAAFEVLKEKVIPHLLQQRRSRDQALRIWVTGCSTGEEAYSMAMVFKEYMLEHNQNFQIQIFATDIDPQTIEKARQGIYADGIIVDVPSERLQRFFTKEEGTFYRVNRDIREMVVFAVQSVIKDPPFSRLDLISCRNLLIYLDLELQKKILPLFHYSLNPDGILFLGSSETCGEFTDLFAIFDKRWKFFRRQEPTTPYLRPLNFPGLPFSDEGLVPAPSLAQPKIKKNNLRELTEKILLERYTPPCVITDKNGEIVYFHGRTGPYLEPPTGEAQLNVLTMAREGLKHELSAAVRKAVTQKETISLRGLQIKDNGGLRTVTLTIQPLLTTEGAISWLLILFEETAPPQPLEAVALARAETKIHSDEYVLRLEQELRSTKEYLQTTIEELETSNEELRSTNEELQSANEELQSTNEELETSKEELQSVNEELVTVNTEFQSKIDELNQVNNDLNNMLLSTDIATIFLDQELNIQRFTPSAARVINLIASDVGRPVEHIVSRLNYSGLVEDATQVLDTLAPKEIEVQSKDGLWYTMRIRPYRTTKNVIEGVVITFVDITGQKRIIEQLSQLNYLQNIVATIREPLLVLDQELRVISASRSFYRVFQVSPTETEHQLIYNLGNRQWDIPKLRRLLNEIITQDITFEDFEITHEFPAIGRRTMLLNARRLYQREINGSNMILLAIEDKTKHQD